eukprot:TRINITY_DN11102_c0_g1_i1.p1 TRINITY_DN11102_c0_g1~~TRINITY_DN11102_c0_g1_i1.p1  ORF type:complete len:327 (+),score=32.92 TRINITY_DN11102_c0_g1_i1:175-1155(+)
MKGLEENLLKTAVGSSPMTKVSVKRFRTKDIERNLPHFATGSFGRIFTGRVKNLNKKTIVIKDMDIGDKSDIEEWKNEIHMMKAGKNPYVVQIYGYCRTKTKMTIVMQYMENGSLYDLLHKKKYPLSVLQRLRIARHSALGLAYLHSRNVIHRDVKSLNILVDFDLSCKLTDFGCAKLINESQWYHTLNRGTPLWMAPEVKLGQYDFSADIYSLGIVFYEVFENLLPLWHQKKQCIVLPNNFKSATMVLPLLEQKSTKRPSASDVVKMLDSVIRHICSKIMLMFPELVELSEGEEIERQLQQLYNHFLTRDPKEVDEVVNKAFTQQ